MAIAEVSQGNGAGNAAFKAGLEAGVNLALAPVERVDPVATVRAIFTAASYHDAFASLKQAPRDVHQEVFDRMKAGVKKVEAAITTDPSKLHAFESRIERPDDHPSIVSLQQKQEQAFTSQGVSGIIHKVVTERLEDQKDITAQDEVRSLTPEQVARLQTQGEYNYRLARDVYGPLTVAFAADITRLQQEGVLPQHMVGLLRDFGPFIQVLDKMGAKVEPAYLRRAIFGMPDELDSSDRMDDNNKKTHYARLARYLRQTGVTTEDDIALLDTGAWGTITGELTILRSALSALSTGENGPKLLAMPAGERLDAASKMLPKNIMTSFEANINDGRKLEDREREIEGRFHLFNAVLSDNVVVAGLDGREFKTTALNFYSHQDEPHRFPSPTNRVTSWVNTVANGSVIENPQAPELICDTWEDIALTSKIYRGPTKFMWRENGNVDVVLRKYDLDTEVSARSALEGINDAYEIWLERQRVGAEVSPKQEVQRVVELSERAWVDETEWSGILSVNTPTWAYGQTFLGEAGPWNKIAGIPETTFYTIDPAAIKKHHAA